MQSIRVGATCSARKREKRAVHAGEQSLADVVISVTNSAIGEGSCDLRGRLA